MSNTNKKKSNKTLRILYAILGISLAGILTFGVWLGIELYRDWQSQSFYTAFAAGIEMRPRTHGNPGNISGPAASAPAPQNQTVDAAAPDGEVLPEPENPWVPLVDFDALNEQFPGVVGWITLEGTAINYPIMQYTDNDYFLTHLPDGTRHRSGSIFMDYRNKSDFSDFNTILYGHMSRTEDMFGVLKHYREQDFYDRNPVMFIHTPYADYQLIIFTVYLVDSAHEQPRISFESTDDYQQYLREIMSRSLVRTNVEMSANYRIVTLATCAYDFANARLVVVGKLVEF